MLWGVKELKLAAAASDTATRMTCKELGEKGAEGNPHVVLTDFVLTDDLVYEHKRKTSDASKWKKGLGTRRAFGQRLREGDPCAGGRRLGDSRASAGERDRRELRHPERGGPRQARGEEGA